MLKKYACQPKKTKGRLYCEANTPHRNEFARDRDRVIHSNAFKRLQYKTQVFINNESDHYRTRMSHSLEVATIARSICDVLGLFSDLAEVIALAHDLGHTPFGHAGEIALNNCMKHHGGFSHNAHSFKILTLLEQKYAAYNGLNLTWEALEGVVKHNGPVSWQESYEVIFAYDRKYSLNLNKYSSAEAQVASLADDIAYICHDLEDSIKAAILTYRDLKQIDFIDQYIFEIKSLYPDINDNVLIYEITRKLRHRLIDSVLAQSRDNITHYSIKTEQDIRNLSRPLINFTDQTQDEVKLIKEYFMSKVYRCQRITHITLQCQKIVDALFKIYAENYNLLPIPWQKTIDEAQQDIKIPVIADYIAGMTDRFAIKQYKSLHYLNPIDIDNL